MEKQPIKGEYLGKCNVSACTNTEPATWYNHSTLKYYCSDCAYRINNDPYNKRDAIRLFGHDLLIQQPAPPLSAKALMEGIWEMAGRSQNLNAGEASNGEDKD